MPPTFFPRAPPLPLLDPPNHAKPPNQVLRRSGGPHTPPDLPSAPWNPQLPTHHFTGAASATGLSTAPNLLDRHHGPPHRICLTGALVHHSVGPSLTPSSAPSLALHTRPRSPQQIRLTESTVHRAGCASPTPSSTAPDPLHGRHMQLHRPCFTDAAASSGYFDFYSFGFSLLYRGTIHLPQMSFLVC